MPREYVEEPSQGEGPDMAIGHSEHAAMTTDPVFGLPRLLATGEQVGEAAGGTLAGRACAIFVTDRRVLAMRLVFVDDLRARGGKRYIGSRVLDLSIPALGAVRSEGQELHLIDLAGRPVVVLGDSIRETHALVVAIRAGLHRLRGLASTEGASEESRSPAAQRVRQSHADWAHATAADRPRFAISALAAVRGEGQNFREDP